MIINDCFKVRGFILVAAFSAGLSLSASALAEEFRSYLIDLNSKAVTPLGTLGRGFYHTNALSLNDAGQVAGYSYFANAHASGPHAFITGPNGMGMRDLGTLGSHFSSASGINDAGQVVGWSSTAAGEDHAFITGPNGMGMRDLGTLGGTYSEAQGINDAGQVVGRSSHAFITGPNGEDMRDLGTLGGTLSVAYGINESGQVVGESDTAAGARHAFITGPNGMGMRDLGTLGGTGSVARGINDAGQVVGHSYTVEQLGPFPVPRLGHAFITGPNGEDMRDLGTLGGTASIAYGINDAGQVVGRSNTAGGDSHAFITGPDGVGMMNLNSLVDLPQGGILTAATGINNNGQVIALALVPEPETYALMLVGLGLIGFIALRKKTAGSG